MLQKHDSVLPNIELISKGNAHGLLLMTLADIESFWSKSSNVCLLTT